MKPSGPKPPAMADGIKFDGDDFQALFDWLRGSTKKGSARDLQALRTLARMFRFRVINVDGGLCRLLADAIDPDGKGAVQLSLKRKSRGRPKRINDYDIAVFVHQRRQSGQKYRLAVEEAMTKFKASRGKVTGAVSKWQAVIEPV